MLDKSLTAPLVYNRTYSRRTPSGRRELWIETVDRIMKGLAELGKLTIAEIELIRSHHLDMTSLTSGRWLWIGGTEWVSKPENYQGAYNCSNIVIDSFDRMGLALDLLMQGCGVGTIIETDVIDKLPVITTQINLSITGKPGIQNELGMSSFQNTEITICRGLTVITVGDSRKGWVDAYKELLKCSAHNSYYELETNVTIDLSHVRAAGTPIKGFGGVSNPSGLKHMLERMVEILNGAVGRKLNSLEVCLLLDEPALAVVAGNVRRSANIRQFSSDDKLVLTAKDGLWAVDEDGKWHIDPKRDALRMSNHTRVFHQKPTLDECIEAVRKQYRSGEGAIQWAGESVMRANVDLLDTPSKKSIFLQEYEVSRIDARNYLEFLLDNSSIESTNVQKELDHRMMRYGTNPCGEIILNDNFCVSGDTQLITKDSIVDIKSSVGKSIEIWNGKRWSSVVPFQTNTNQKLYRITFGDGTYLDTTEYHRFFVKDRFGSEYKEVLAKDLMTFSKYSIHTEPFEIEYADGIEIDCKYAYAVGFAVGDGTADGRSKKVRIPLYGKKQDIDILGRRRSKREASGNTTVQDVVDFDFSLEFIQSLKTNADAINLIASWSRESIIHFIAGLADADGSNTAGNGIRIYISDRERAYRIQLLLTKCGIRSSLNLMATKGAATNFGIRKQDLYYLQISNCIELPCQRLDVSKGDKPNRKGKWQIIRAVEELPGLHDTFCFNEPEFHKGVFGNTLTGNCNLSEVHLNLLDPLDTLSQSRAFKAAAISACALLHHQFIDEKMQYSREIDPIVGVSFTGLFDFFVNLFGVDWLKWWEAGRPDKWSAGDNDYLPLSCIDEADYFRITERHYLSNWRLTVESTVAEYCERHNLKRPNRCTTVQPAGTKSLLTGASPGWHPPKAQRFIRRITFRREDPVALAALDYGYSVIPSQSDKDEHGNLLDDPFDPRCTEWLVEVPIEVPWANLEGADAIDVNRFSAAAQFDFYMQIQQWYTAHSTSATIEFREHEIEALGEAIYRAILADEGYISAALLARFDASDGTFPRLPFEPIDKDTYDRLIDEMMARRIAPSFEDALANRDMAALAVGSDNLTGPIACDSDKCLMPDRTK